MKRIISILMTLLIAFSANVTAFAADSYIVSADKVSVSKGETQLAPVNIKSNKGIMGFKITVEYDVSKIDIKSVSRGTVTAKGNFNTNFGVNDGKFDIVWNNTDEITDDGSLFVLSLSAEKSADITLSFSQPDTFNEKYEDVKLVCNNISVEITDQDNTEATEKDAEKTTDKTSETSETPTVDNSQIIEAIDAAMEQNGYTSITEVNDDTEFISQVNKNLETITGTDAYNVDNIDTLKSLYNSAYEGEFVTEVTNNIDSAAINSAISDALESVGASSIDEIPDDKKADFVKAVEENLKKSDSDTPNISQDISTDTAIDIIKKIANENNTDENGTDNSAETENNTTAIIISVVCAIVVIALIAYLVIRKKKQKSKPIE